MFQGYLVFFRDFKDVLVILVVLNVDIVKRLKEESALHFFVE